MEVSDCRACAANHPRRPERAQPNPSSRASVASRLVSPSERSESPRHPERAKRVEGSARPPAERHASSRKVASRGARGGSGGRGAHHAARGCITADTKRGWDRGWERTFAPARTSRTHTRCSAAPRLRVESRCATSRVAGRPRCIHAPRAAVPDAEPPRNGAQRRGDRDGSCDSGCRSLDCALRAPLGMTEGEERSAPFSG
jgi:hypothetical protein